MPKVHHIVVAALASNSLLLLPQINAVDTRPRIVRMGELRNGKTLYDLT